MAGSLRMDDLVAPADLARTRVALHRLAAYVIAPARYAATERFGLRSTPGGFGTPEFGTDRRRIRVDGTELVDERADTERRAPISTLAAAAAFLGTSVDADVAAEEDTPARGDVDEPLHPDPVCVDFLGRWYAMAFTALERVRADPASVDASEPQLWPGHFDAAIEAGDDAHRASYGASPGDDHVDEPYLYVSVWWPDRVDFDWTDPTWNSDTFSGRVLRLSAFPAEVEPTDVAFEFWATTRDLLDAR